MIFYTLGNGNEKYTVFGFGCLILKAGACFSSFSTYPFPICRPFPLLTKLKTVNMKGEECRSVGYADILTWKTVMHQ